MNPERTAATVERILRDAVLRTGFRRGIVGLTGRVDEAVVGALAARALGREQIRLVRLVDPEGGEEASARARAAADHLGAATEVVPLDPYLEALSQTSPEANAPRRRAFLARIRTALLHDRAAAHRALVLGAASKSDRMLGRGSSHGEEACALNPVGDLYATEVQTLAAHLALPDEVVEHEPEVEIPSGAAQGGAFRPTYAWIDPLLRHIVDGRLRRQDLVELGYERADVQRVVAAIRRSGHRRRPPVVPTLTRHPA